MKKIIIFLLVIMMCNLAFGETTTPTDLLEEIDDEDWGEIEIKFERQVFISINNTGKHFGDTVTITATLINFQTDDIYTFQWQYAEALPNWKNIQGAQEQIYSFILTKENYLYWYRVLVEL